MICLDTNVVIAVLNDPKSPVRKKLDDAIGRGDAIAISTIVLFELRYGAAKSARPDRNAKRITDFLAGPVEVWHFEPEDAEANEKAGWLDQNAGIAQIPVADAMKIIAEKGLPAAAVAPAEKKKK